MQQPPETNPAYVMMYIEAMKRAQAQAKAQGEAEGQQSGINKAVGMYGAKKAVDALGDWTSGFEATDAAPAIETYSELEAPITSAISTDLSMPAEFGTQAAQSATELSEGIQAGGEIPEFSSTLGSGAESALGYGDPGYAGNWMGPVGLAAGGYGMYDAYKKGKPLQGAIAGAGAGAGLVGTAGLMGYGLPVLAGMGPLGWAIASGMLLGGGAGLLGGHKSTKQRQAERSGELAESNPGYANYLQTSQEKSGLIGDLMKKGSEATADDYKGWWDDPSTEEKEWVWVNKQLQNPESVTTPEQMSQLGSGDVMWHPWFGEQFGEDWYGVPWEVRDKIATSALENAGPTGNAGNIDFNPDEEWLKWAKEQMGQGE